MRLLNVWTLELEEFFDHPFEDPEDYRNYAILSHTWTPGEEVLYKDCDDLKAVLQQTAPWQEGGLSKAPSNHIPGGDYTSDIREHEPSATKPKKGHAKIKGCCELAQIQGYNYVWIDTCCIDKSSSAELSEAINSMFSYYEHSAVCYVFLEDVDQQKGDMFKQLRCCRWAERGWTLQELIAPGEVEFYDKAGKVCGTRQSLAAELEQVTGIDIDVLKRGQRPALDLSQFSIAQRMSWAAWRITTRPEDIAYCLLGLFDVNIPLLYGEGYKKAFYRLQEEIMKHSMDQSILAWKRDEIDLETPLPGILAESPFDFVESADIVCFWGEGEPYEITNKGLRATLPVIHRPNSRYLEVALNCRRKSDLDCPVSLHLATTANNLYNRLNDLHLANWEEVRKSPSKMLYLNRNTFNPTKTELEGYCFWFKFNGSSAIHGEQLRYWRLYAPSDGKLIQKSKKIRLDLDAVHTATTSKLSTYFVEYSEKSEPTKHPRLRFTIKRGEIFHCTDTVIFPSYVCGFEDLFGDELLPTYHCTRGDFKHRIQSSMEGLPKRVMGEYVYEINVDFKIEFRPTEKGKSDARSSHTPVNS